MSTQFRLLVNQHHLGPGFSRSLCRSQPSRTTADDGELGKEMLFFVVAGGGL